MPINGTVGLVLSDGEKNKKSVSEIMKSLADANNSAKKLDPKNAKKAKK